MGIQLVVVLVALAVAGVWGSVTSFESAATQPIVHQQLVDTIHARQSQWNASTKQGSTVEGATFAFMAQMLRAKMSRPSLLPLRTYAGTRSASASPASFDAALRWPECPTITMIRDQSACGDCWAVAPTTAISDRYCTYGIHKNLSLSAADPLECCSVCGMGCSGGDPASVWYYWRHNGIVSETCMPYPFPKCEHMIPQNHYPPCPAKHYPTPQCPKGGTCSATGQGNYSRYFGNASWSLRGEQDYMQELQTNGPFIAAMSVYEDFFAYKSGVYVHTTGKYVGGHAVKVVGWGSLGGVPYWRVANSWNTDWGMDGYFLIKRGDNECGIEQDACAGAPSP